MKKIRNPYLGLEEKGYTVAVKTIFSCKDIRELAERLEEAKAEYVYLTNGRKM